MCNSLTNVSLKDEKCNLLPESIKSVKNLSSHQLLSVTVKKVVYVAQRDEFVTKKLANMVISNCQHKDIFVMKYFLDFRSSRSRNRDICDIVISNKNSSFTHLKPFLLLLAFLPQCWLLFFFSHTSIASFPKVLPFLTHFVPDDDHHSERWLLFFFSHTSTASFF